MGHALVVRGAGGGGAIAAAWVTVTATPAIVRLALRDAGSVFAAMLIATDEGPVPPAGFGDAQFALLLVVHEHAEPVVTCTDSLPAAAATERAVGVTE